MKYLSPLLLPLDHTSCIASSTLYSLAPPPPCSMLHAFFGLSFIQLRSFRSLICIPLAIGVLSTRRVCNPFMYGHLVLLDFHPHSACLPLPLLGRRKPVSGFQ